MTAWPVRLGAAIADAASGGRRAGIVRLGVAVALAAATAPGAARADWSDARVLSASATQQAESGTQPAISRDGRYVVFEGSYAGTFGVWRKRLADGALELVTAGGSGPSVSADGRFVAFTTRARLDPANDPNAVGDVYVRDMELPDGAAGAFTLASAVDGAATALGYSGGSGSAAAPRVALSADGRSVAFTVLSASDLTGGAPGSTPAAQVALRRLDEQRTILVSTGIDRATRQQTTAPVPGGAFRFNQTATAALSGDGTTVAWMATNVAEQVPVLAGEAAAMSRAGFDYVEPLWRRVADGADAPVRRVTGGGDPFDPACPAGGAASEDRFVVAPGVNPCDGPFALSRAADQGPGTLSSGGTPPQAPDATPQLSADGWTVAILVAEPLRASSVAPSRPATANAYVVDMRQGLTRSQALRPLTAWASTDFGNDLLTAEVLSIAISPDGTRVAFSTPRGAFPLAPPLLLDPPLGQVGDSELYDVDLTRGETRRVTRQYDGSALERQPSGFLFGGSFAPSYSGDGRLLAFASQSPKLFFGDGNGAGDVFVAEWSEPDAGPGPPRQAVGATPPPVATRPLWRIGATARSRRDGRVALEVVVPAAGTVSARATTAVASTARRRRAGAKRARVVATRSARARRPGLVVVVLTPGRGERLPARGLSATAAITFSAGSRRLRASVPIRFTKPSRRRATGAPAGRAAAGRRR
jgi:WD40-like Beta Propeller Repeat